MRKILLPILLAFMPVLVLTDVALSVSGGLPRWVSLPAGAVAGGLVAWGIYRLITTPEELAARRAWVAEQRRIAAEESRKPHPRLPADLPPADPDGVTRELPADPDFETRELGDPAPQRRSSNRVDRAVERATSFETPADRAVRKATDPTVNRIERFFD